MVDVAEGVGPVERLHNLLLAMTGRVDDDAINSARELLGVGQLDAAAEFLAGCLLAGQIPVTSTEQYHLRRVLDEALTEHTLADRLHVVESLPDEDHRFGDQYESDRELIDALAPVAGRLDGVRALWCAWRTTPAGVTYGAVPRRVLLAEVGADGSVAAAGYQLIEALRRAGIGCSVDVFTSGMDLPDYHRSALAAAHRVHLDIPVASSTNGSSRARAPRMSSASEPAGAAGGSDLPGEPSHSPPPREEERPVEISREPPSTQMDTPPSGLPTRAPQTESVPVEEAVPVEQALPVEQAVPVEQQAQAETKGEGSKNMRVPAAVDAKLTDRERNLLRKLHEELAQREQDRGGDSAPGRRQARGEQQAVPTRGGQADPWTTTPGTGGFPPISNPNHGNQQSS